MLELNGARYMIRGLGYLRSLADLENVPVATKNGTPVLIRDLGTRFLRARTFAKAWPNGTAKVKPWAASW